MSDLTAGGVPVARDSAGVLRETPDRDRIDGLASSLAGKADVTSVPKPADTAPMAEKTGAAIGSKDTRYALADHQHPRLTSTTYATLGSDGKATVTFSRTFTNKPGLNMTETDAALGSQPLVIRGMSWVQDAGGLYIGVNIQGSRAQLMPTLTALSGALTLVTQVVSGVNNLVASLAGYNVFGGSAAGATVSVIAVARSDVAAT